MGRIRDPFTHALGELREDLRLGVLPAGRPIVIAEAARRLGLSTTPVREALAQLCGEGLIERGPVDGYLAPRFSVSAAQDRYAFRLQCLLIGLERVAEPRRLAVAGPGSRDPSARLQDRFGHLVQASGNAALVEAFERVRLQLFRVEVAEAKVFADLEQEAVALLERFGGDEGSRLRDALSAYHQRRIAACPLLALAAETAGAVRPPTPR